MNDKIKDSTLIPPRTFNIMVSRTCCHRECWWLPRSRQ